MFNTIEEELPDTQAIADGIDMVGSIFDIYDVEGDGMDWGEFKEMALIDRTAFNETEID